MSHPCSKTRPADHPYEVWQNVVPVLGCPPGTWTWRVLKKYQGPEREAQNLEARWFCDVRSPLVPDGELGGCLVRDITSVARRIQEGRTLC